VQGRACNDASQGTRGSDRSRREVKLSEGREGGEGDLKVASGTGTRLGGRLPSMSTAALCLI
jgi:hypothetical protein